MDPVAGVAITVHCVDGAGSNLYFTFSGLLLVIVISSVPSPTIDAPNVNSIISFEN